MHYRDNRYPSKIRAQVDVDGAAHIGLVLNISRVGLLAQVDRRLRRGKPVRIKFVGMERDAVVTRNDTGRVAFRFRHPLSMEELRRIRAEARNGSSGGRFFSEM